MKDPVQYFSALLDHSEYPAVLVDESACIIAANRPYRDMFTWVDACPVQSIDIAPWNTAAVRRFLNNAWRDVDGFQSRQFECKTTHGLPRTFVCKRTSLPQDLFPNGSALISFLDCTQICALEDERNCLELQFETFVNGSVQALVLIDETGRIRQLNPAAEVLFGHTADQVLGENVRILMPSPYSGEHDSYLKNYFATGVKKVIGLGREVTGLRNDGTTFPMELSVSEVNYAGRPHFMGTVRDVTQSKRAAKALQNSEARAKAVLNTAVDAIISIDEKGIVKSVNPAARQLFGYSAAEIVGENVSMLMPLPYRDEHDSYLESYLQTGEKKVIGTGREVVGRRKDGTTFPMELAVSECIIGNQRSFTGIVRDISEYKTAEATILTYAGQMEEAQIELQLQAEQLESTAQELRKAKLAADKANEAKSGFLSNMSHEIRSPLTSILGFAEVLADEISDPHQRESAATIHRNGKHLLELINDILDVAKIEAGKIVLERINYCPTEVIEDVTAILRNRADEKGISLESDCRNLSAIQGDPTRFRQVVTNLLSNAIKFTDTGRVSIRASIVGEEQKRLHVEVSDTGIGMTTDQLERIFQPFEQADLSTTRQYGGTGLGLVIVKNLVELQGGKIEVESQLGRGSSFRFSIGVFDDGISDRLTEQRQNTANGKGTDSADLSLAGVQVLVVEDGPDNQRFLNHVLKKAGAVVTILENGRLACEHITRVMSEEVERVDIVLMDVQMPVMDGIDATKELRAMGFTYPIIAVTAQAMKDDAERCLQAGCDDYLAKPMSRNALYSMISKHVHADQRSTSYSQ